MNMTELRNDENFKYFLSHMKDVVKPTFPGFVQPLVDASVLILNASGCPGIPMLKNMSAYLDYCSEDQDRMFPVRSLRYYCPVECGCRATDLSCPSTCPT